MSLEGVILRHVRVPLVEPFRISNGSVSEKDGIIVTVLADGIAGHGEASPMSGSFYSDDTPESVWADLRTRLVPALLASPPGSAAEASALVARLGGSGFARAGVETAFWDLEAARAGVPLWKSLGGSGAAVPSGLAVGIYPTIPALLRAVERHLREGYRRLKIKIQPGWDEGPLEAVRGHFGDIPLMVDANCAYSREDIPRLAALDRFGMMMVEQPLARADLEGHALLQAAMRTPVCLDEGAEDEDAVRRAIALASCRVVNIKIQRVGGLAAALRIHRICSEAGIGVWAGTMPELGVGAAQTLHLATLPNFRYPTDVESSRRWFEDDIVEPPIEVREGMIAIPGGAGNCYRLNEAACRRHLVAEETFR